MNTVTKKKHWLNPDLMQIFVDGNFWANVPKKEAAAAVRELQSQLSRDPWYCYRRGY